VKLTLDTDGMLEATASLPEQLRDAAAAARGAVQLPDASEVRQILVAGMGGSGVSGAVLDAVGTGSLPVPVVLCSGYEPPAFAGPGTLVFAVSFSGGTEETVSVARIAAERGAHVVAVSKGGDLGALAEEIGAGHYEIAATCKWPRSGIGALSAPLLVACEEIGLLPGVGAQIDATFEQLARRRDALLGPSGDVAAEVARRIGRTIPLAYGAPPAGSVAARRLKTQVNENVKMPAFFASYPELCHNEICGWGLQGDVTRQLMTVVNMRTDCDHPRVAVRFELVDDLIREAVADIVTITAEGEGVLAQLFDLVLIGDFASLHIAEKEGVDPGPIPVLTDLKEMLQRM
jgi:glucose/mannose-6-phosphate isomerase